MINIKIEGLNNTKKGMEIISCTIVGTFDIGDGIRHAFQVSLEGDDLLLPPLQQKQIVKDKIKSVIKNFKKASIVLQENSSAWNEDYNEDV